MWGIVALLAAAAVFLFVLYRRSVAQRGYMTKYALLLLLDDSACAAQRRWLHELVRNTPTGSAIELGSKIDAATAIQAARIPNTMLGVAGMLWKLKQHPPEPSTDLLANAPPN
jgi:hypothetical protein